MPRARILHPDRVSLEDESTRAGPPKPAPVVMAPRGFVPEPGDEIGRYVVRDLIAEGGMGMIYTADDPELGRVVAIKLLLPDLTGPADEQQHRLQREAQAMARVSHGNLVTVFDVGTHKGQVFIAMEYVEGVTLKVWLAPKRSWRDVVGVFCGAGQGLAAAHKAGLVHRDFKPANVVVGDDGTAQVLDFGLVRRAGEADDPVDDDDDDIAPREDTLAIDLTRTGSVMGTPAYMAPEQHLGNPTDERSDQFSFCVAMYEALYDERPFPGQDAGRVTMAVLENERRPKPRETEVPEAIYKALDRGLAREPEERWSSMEPLLQALRGELDQAATPSPGKPSRTPWLIAAGVAVILAVGGAIAFGGEEELEPTPAEAVADEPSAEDSGAKKRSKKPTSAKSRPAAPGTTPSKKKKGGKSGKSKKPDFEDRGTELPGVEEEPTTPSANTAAPPEDPAPTPEPQPDPEDPPAE